ncbi:alpha/beta hydrolase [Antrihabitans spumae]|uniref:Alpha/beta hydrolase n=1 Tax=Antrihabitans spumae TaxID=3373370 RepID=A0ABW7K4C7_9NOCA
MRSTRLAAVLGMIVALCCACGVGPSDRPVVATERDSQGSGGDNSTSTPPPENPLPALEKPKTDLEWRDCTRALLEVFDLGAGPAGLVLDCAEFSAAIDKSGNNVYGTFTVGALRARLPQTPVDAAPLVLTSGADRASSGTLASLAIGPAAGLLASRPIVAIDRRGIGNSQPIECIAPEQRRQLLDLAQFSLAGEDAADAVAKLSQDATIACKDFLQPQELAFDAIHAADDLEELRSVWQVDTLALLGTGNGAKVALSYAAKYPKHVSRLILDSPEGLGLDATQLTDHRLQGAEAAITAFATRCTGLNCALGPDPRKAITDLVNRARAGQLGSISSNALLTAISGFLGSPRGDQPSRVTVLADTLAAAAAGDTAALQSLIAREEALTEGDGQFINRCSDGQQWPPPQRVRELQKEWGEKFPIFGPEAAVTMLACSAWPVAQAPPAPSDLKIPVLVLSGAADPVTGNSGVSSVTGAIGNAGGQVSALSWQGWGHPVTAHSGCAQDSVVAYVNDGKLPPNGTVCPA